MATYEVETEIQIACKVKVLVEADSKSAAVDAAADLLPSNSDPDASKRWKATVELKAPKGVNIAECKPYHFQQASGNDRAKLVK